MPEFIRMREVGPVLEITLDKPKVNAICRQLARELHAAACRLRDSEALKVGILTATGTRAFSAGWDFNEALSRPEDDDGSISEPGGFAGITAMWDLSKPLIAAVNGPAIGGGFEMALACDMIVMAEDAYFQLPELQRGFLPDVGGIQRLPRRVPHNVATAMIYTGRRMPAAEAAHWGLAHTVLPADALLEKAHEIAAEIATGAPLAVMALKEVLTAIEQLPLPEAMRVNAGVGRDLPVFSQLLTSEDAREGPRAFLERRAPQWKGR